MNDWLTFETTAHCRLFGRGHSGSLHHLDLDDIDDNGDSNHINSLMMIEMGDFANLDAIHPLDVVSVDLTLDQELSEDERSIQQLPTDNNGDGIPR